MISEPTLNAIYRFLRPSAAVLLSKQRDTAPKRMEVRQFAEIWQREQEFFARKLKETLPREIFAAPGEQLQEGYCWRFIPINEPQCFRQGMPRWCMVCLGYLDGKLHKFLVMEPASGDYYWGRKNGGIFSRTQRLRVNRQEELHELAVGLHNWDGAAHRLPPRLTTGGTSAAANNAANNAAAESEESEGANGKKLTSSESRGLVSICVSTGSPLLDLLDCAAAKLDMFVINDAKELFPAARQITLLDAAELSPLAKLIVQEAGGLVGALDGTILDRHRAAGDASLIAGNPELVNAYSRLSQN